MIINPEERLDGTDDIKNYFFDHQCLLIIDNFESYFEQNYPNKLLTNDLDKKAIKDFLKYLKDGKSKVIITTTNANL